MTINIISNQAKKNKIRGPKKVFDNTIIGLNMLGVKCVYNQPLEKYDYNWIQDNQAALIQASFISKACVLGPNLAVFPSDLPFLRKKINPSSVFLFPSNWPLNVWQSLNFEECTLGVWPSGINTSIFQSNNKIKKEKVLLYFKNRDPEILKLIIKILNKNNYDFVLFEYGNYNESDYLEAIHKSKFGIWVGSSESQGYAILEALSCGLPLIVLDVLCIEDVFSINGKLMFSKKNLLKFKNINVTSAPYFNEKCGIVIENIDEFENSLIHMNVNYKKFDPRSYILDNFSLDYSAKNLLKFFSHLETSNKMPKFNFYYASYCIYYFQLIFKLSSWKRLILKLL